jgi:deoxyribodipyrimidine photolyase-related protein
MAKKAASAKQGVEAGRHEGKRLRFVLGDQLTRGLSSLRDVDPERDVILLVEVADETRYVPHHPKKIAFILSAMRHFAEALTREGLTVDYVPWDAAGNTGTFTGELERAVKRHRPDAVVLTEPGEWRVAEMVRRWPDALGVRVEVREDDRFVASHADFEAWARGKKSLRMEFFYREMRRKTGLLMDGDEPVGGEWNLDAENRKRLPARPRIPERVRFEADAITRDVLALVAREHHGHYGSVDGFGWAVTRTDALRALEHFVADCLPSFGDYQDAMKRGEPFLYHAVLSPYLNVGLLEPLECCRAAEEAYREGRAPLNAVEGFVRQIIGWREYVRGLYWLDMPRYRETNFLEATRPLPEFFWTGETDLACVKECVKDTMQHAYAHHIQRLMVLGNFALLAGLAPAEVEEWYLAVYADAFEWVELPNVHGMVLFADGGRLGSKPYAASGAYIHRMSDYCEGCRYSPDEKAGERACPFNPLYWNFLLENEARLAKNPRMAMPYRNLAKMPAARKAEIRADAARFLSTLAPSKRGRELPVVRG